MPACLPGCVYLPLPAAACLIDWNFTQITVLPPYRFCRCLVHLGFAATVPLWVPFTGLPCQDAVRFTCCCLQVSACHSAVSGITCLPAWVGTFVLDYLPFCSFYFLHFLHLPGMPAPLPTWAYRFCWTHAWVQCCSAAFWAAGYLPGRSAFCTFWACTCRLGAWVGAWIPGSCRCTWRPLGYLH